MPNLKNAVQIDQFFAGVRDGDGAILAGGTVIGYIVGARSSSGGLIYRRASLWKDANRKFPFGDGKVSLDASGLPVVLAAEFPSVYGSGSIFLCYYAAGATTPNLSEVGTPFDPQSPAPPGFSDPVRTETIHVSAEIVNAAHFGTVGNGKYGGPGQGVDDTDALQAAIDYCLIDSDQHPKSLFIPGGTYRITRPLVVLQTYIGNAGAPGIGYCAIQIYGEKRGLLGGYGDTVIYAEFTDGPAIAIQGGYGVVIRDLTLAGTNRYDISMTQVKNSYPNDQSRSYAAYHDDLSYFYDWTSHPWDKEDPPITQQPYPLYGKCRDNVQSPHAGIAIDPFSPDVTDLNQYPSLTAYYNNFGENYVYSSGIVVENCQFYGFVVGIVISPSGRNANAENIVLRNLHFQTNKVCLAICQSQTRGIHVENFAVLQCQMVVDCRSYGAGTAGTPPNIRGMIVSEAKYLFNIVTGSLSVNFDQIYAEASLSIGYLGAEKTPNQGSVNISGSTFDFQHIRPAINAHLTNFAPVRFTGCMFAITVGSGEAEYPPVMFDNQALLVFQNCALQAGRPGSSVLGGVPVGYDWGWANSAPAWGFNEPLLVRIEGIHLRDNVDGGHTASAVSTVLRTEHLSVAGHDAHPNGLTHQIVPAGARIAPAATLTGFTPYHRIVKGTMNEIPIGNVLVTKKGYSLDFSGAPNLLLPGDVVYAYYPNATPAKYPLFVPKYEAPAAPLEGRVAHLSPTDGYRSPGPIGVITKASSGDNTIGFVPKTVLDVVPRVGGLNLILKIRRFGRYHPATTGDYRHDSPTITNVAVEGLSGASSAWKAGDRIATDRITLTGTSHISPGTYVVGTTTTTITLSRNPNADATGARLFDADVYRFSGVGE